MSVQATLEQNEPLDSERCHTFRLTFHSATKRILLPYPKVIHLKFRQEDAADDLTWYTRVILSGVPLDMFVIGPGGAISFALHTCFVDCSDPSERRFGLDSVWHLNLEPSVYCVRYAFPGDHDWSAGLIERLSREAEIRRAALYHDPVESNVIAIQHGSR